MNIKKIWEWMNEYHAFLLFLGIYFLFIKIMRMAPGTRIEDAAGLSALAVLISFVMTPVVRRWVLYWEESWAKSLKAGLVNGAIFSSVLIVLVLVVTLLGLPV